MPRIRSLKPEHKAHRKIGPLSDRQYRLWVGMMTEADDEGRLVADAAQLRMVVFGYHPHVRVEHVEAALQAIAATGVVKLYVVDGVRYAWFPSWNDHQVINKRHKSALPEYSGNGTGTLPEQYGSAPVAPAASASTRKHVIPVVLPERYGSTTVGSESLGSESLGKEQSNVGLPPDVTPLSGYRRDAETVLAFLNAKTGRTYRATPANLALIEARLKAGASVEDCRGVIVRKVRAWATDPKMAMYLRPATLFNATKFDQYIGEQGRPS